MRGRHLLIMQSLLNDFDLPYFTTPGDVWGLWMVTTVLESKGLEVGDHLRVLYCSDKGAAFCYLMCRAKNPRWASPMYDADEHARSKRICHWVPITHLWVLHMPRTLPPMSDMAKMEPFLTKSSHLIPPEGWVSYLNASGVKATFKPPMSWQFGGVCWGRKRSGKTGGLHMTLNSDSSRRCQLSVEVGVCGDSLVDTMPGTKAGVLVYLPNMNIMANGKQGEDVCYDSTISLTFSALLMVYTEALSIVRKAVYVNPRHPRGGVEYPNIEWDFFHTPFTKPWVVGPNKTPINLHLYAKERARFWIQAEMVASPLSWTTPPSRTPEDKNDPLAVKMEKRGVNTWIQSSTSDLKSNTIYYQKGIQFF